MLTFLLNDQNKDSLLFYEMVLTVIEKLITKEYTGVLRLYRAEN